MAEGWTKLTPERAERLLALVKAGQYRSTACAAVGISDRTLRTWLEKGDSGDERWAEFTRKFREAEAETESRAVVQIQIHGKKDWRALAWWLERRFPQRWGDLKAATVKIEQERETILDALVKALEKRGLGDAAEEVFGELAASGGGTAGDSAGASTAKH